jgi:hypothetical protein
MKRKGLLCVSVALLAFAIASSAQTWDADLPASLDKLSANAWQPNLLTAFGTFTYADSSLPSPFSRYLEENLATAITKTSRLRLFNKSVAAAMDPAFRSVYEDFFKSNDLDALLSGRYYIEGSTVRAHLELTSLKEGVLIGTLDLKLPMSAIPQDVAIDPSAAASATASSIGSLASDSGRGSLKVSVSTERGAGAVYREGEKMVVLVAVNKSAWLKVYHIDAIGVVRLIWPNAYTSGRRLDPGSVVYIPGPGDSFSFDMTPPFGTEFIKVIASTQPFAADETASAGGALFAELGTDARGAITRGIKVNASGPAEKAESMASYLITKAR